MKVTEEYVKDLVLYALDKGLIEKEDAVYAGNSLFAVLDYEPASDFRLVSGDQGYSGRGLEEILKALLDDAVSRGVIEDGITDRDLFDTRLMGCLTPRPSEVIRRFKELYQNSPKEATDYFYKLSRDSDYIRTYRIAKDIKWTAATKYGELDITINLSKPEKDPKAIAAALKKSADAYPKCLLCIENEGYRGRLDHPARQNIRLIPMELGGSRWYMQYSPYVYYNEHCIVLSEEHSPMKINKETFGRLMEFVTFLPHYVIGSNADLPIVGGSILSHEHFQGGNYEFPMARAGERFAVEFKGYEGVKACVLDWPMSVIRLRGEDSALLVELADKILKCWRAYSDRECGIFAETGGTPHNTITPIVRRRDKDYEIDLVLRNNRTTEEYPLGIFHPHQELHHIKKENIGLIEVMGLAILPARLKKEMEILKDTILKGEELSRIEEIASHADWAADILKEYPEFAPANVKNDAASAEKLDKIIKTEIGLVFMKVLEHSGVYKDSKEGNEGIRRFIDAVNGC
ncbi:MAG: UDP-glucose--hexose-1-phosphate uridylyltransferase [Lachnospiraceae bacterium]|nr:UDP-glucose--hexose-1-phosphate uridylyltransferase [Lachnospiraceae bacterium]